MSAATEGPSPRRARLALMVGESATVVGALVLAVPMRLAFAGQIPFAAPASWAIYVILLIAVVATLGIEILRRSIG